MIKTRPSSHCLLFLVSVFSLVTLPAQAQGQNAISAVKIEPGQSVIPLNGPWKFRTGDDPRWSDLNFDDEDWSTVDLTPPPGAHDDDVGLTGYVPGWTAKGHPAYWGYAWYRIRISIAPLPKTPIALSGPPAVDDAYQVFFDGHLLGNAGDFSAATPVVYSIQPRVYLLPQSLHFSPAENEKAESNLTHVIAFRVWMSHGSVSPGTGGIHIAPAIGDAGAIEGRYRLQWQQTVLGYIVEVIEPFLFVLLVVMTCVLIAFDPTNSAYRWLTAGLLVIAAIRANQAFYFWTQSESINEFDLVKSVLLIPLGLGAWTMTWRAWFCIERPAFIGKGIVALTMVYMVLELLTRTWFPVPISHQITNVLTNLSMLVRLMFVLILAYIVCKGVRQQKQERWLSLLVLILLSIGLFAPELSALHIQGIWFPYGVGVSRTQYAYAALVPALFALLLRRLLIFARVHRRLSVATEVMQQKESKESIVSA